MKISAIIEQEVSVDPLEVIEKLINRETGGHRWVTKRDEKYFFGEEQSAGQHSYESFEEISEERYNYIKALETVRRYLKDNKI